MRFCRAVSPEIVGAGQRRPCVLLRRWPLTSGSRCSEAIADDPEGRPADRVRAVDLLGRLGGVAKDEPIPNELVRLLAMDVGAVARSADFGGTDDAEGFLSHVYDRWAVTLGAFRAGDT